MAKVVKKDQVEIDPVTVDNIDFDFSPAPVEVAIEAPAPAVKTKSVINKVNEAELINPLRNVKVEIKLVNKSTPIVNSSDKKHPLSGGMADGAVRTYCVPTQRNGQKVNVLTNNEKAFFEQLFGLEPGAMNATRKVDNYWDDIEVHLHKYGNILDLSDPYDYIKYKVLLACKDRICPSIKDLRDNRLYTYDFVICNEEDEVEDAQNSMSMTMKCYKEYGKIEEEKTLLRVIIETMDNNRLVPTTKLALLQKRANELIQRDPKFFYATITDELLRFKALIKDAYDAGYIVMRDTNYYLRDGNLPLCGNNETPSFVNAAKFLANPKNSDVLFALQAKLGNK